MADAGWPRVVFRLILSSLMNYTWSGLILSIGICNITDKQLFSDYSAVMLISWPSLTGLTMQFLVLTNRMGELGKRPIGREN